MARYGGAIIGALAGAVIAGAVVLVGYHFADHDSWARALTWAAIWIVLMTATSMGTHIWQERRADRDDADLATACERRVRGVAAKSR